MARVGLNVRPSAMQPVVFQRVKNYTDSCFVALQAMTKRTLTAETEVRDQRGDKE
jgi:hypothetical protein